MKRYRITIDQAALLAGKPAINMQDTACQRHETLPGRSYKLDGAIIVQGLPQQDGARLWVECDKVVRHR